MKKYLFFLTAMLVLPLALCAQQSANVNNLIESYADRKGVAYVELAKPIINNILCRQSGTAKAKLDPCSSPDVFKSLDLPASDTCMREFKEAAAKDKFSVLKRTSGVADEMTYYAKELKDGRSEVLLVMVTEFRYYPSEDRVPEKTRIVAHKISVAYMEGSIDVARTGDYLSRILNSLQVEAHINDRQKPLDLSNSKEQPIQSLDGLSVEELNALIASYQNAIDRVKGSTSKSSGNPRGAKISILQRQIDRFQAKIEELNTSSTS